MKIRDNRWVVWSLVVMCIVQIMIAIAPGLGKFLGIDRLPLLYTIGLMLLAIPILVAMELFKLVWNATTRNRNGKN